MVVNIQSTQAQQNFGEVMGRAMQGEDVVVERYGAPAAAILAYERYQALVAAERELQLLKLKQAAALAEVRADYLTDDEVDALIEQARQDVHEGRAKG